MLKKRCIDLVGFLLNQTGSLTMEQVAREFGVSTRTVRNDLDAVDEWLGENGFEAVQRVPNRGVRLEDSSGAVARAAAAENIPGYLRSPEERMYTVVGLLLGQRRVGNREMAEALDVSSATISGDLRRARDWMGDHGIQLDGNPQEGITGPTDEKDVRRGLLFLLLEILDLPATKQAMIRTRFAGVGKRLAAYGLGDICDTLNRWQTSIWGWIEMMQKRQGQVLSDDGICEMFLHLAVTLTRILQKHTVHFTENERRFILRRRQSIFARDFIAAVESETGLVLGEEEELYIALLWMSLRKYSGNENVCIDDILLARDILRTVKDEMGLDFEEDEAILAKMSSHISTLFYRMMLRLPETRSEAAEGVKRDFPAVFSVARRKLDDFLALNELDNKVLSDEEVAFLAMYVMANMYSKMPVAKRKRNVLLVCASTIGTSQVLKQRLRMMIADINIVGEIPYNEYLERADFSDVDLIISTVPLENSPQPHIVVDPLLKQQDLNRLLNTLQLQQQTINVNKYIEASLHIASRSLGLTPEMELKLSIDLVNQIAGEMKSFRPKQVANLRNMLGPEVVQVQMHAKDCYDAIQLAGNPLIRLGLITQQHVDEMKRIKRKLGGYIVIAKGFALPHHLGLDLSGPCVSLLTLAQPVPFQNAANDPVDVIVMLLTNDKIAHLQIIEDLIDLLEDSEKMEEIRRAKSTAQLLRLLQ